MSFQHTSHCRLAFPIHNCNFQRRLSFLSLKTVGTNYARKLECSGGLHENDVQTMRGNWSVRWDSMKMIYKLCEETGVFGRNSKKMMYKLYEETGVFGGTPWKWCTNYARKLECSGELHENDLNIPWILVKSTVPFRALKTELNKKEQCECSLEFSNGNRESLHVVQPTVLRSTAKPLIKLFSFWQGTKRSFFSSSLCLVCGEMWSSLCLVCGEMWPSLCWSSILWWVGFSRPSFTCSNYS